MRLIIGRTGHFDQEPTLLQVARQTEKRIYCTVHPLCNSYLKGRAPDTYIDREDVIAEDVTVEQFNQYIETYRRYQAVIKATVALQKAELRRLHVEYNDELQGVIDGFKAAQMR